MEKITKEEIKLLKENIDKMALSSEQFIFMLFKNKDGADNITGYSFNIPPGKIGHFLREELMRGKMRK